MTHNLRRAVLEQGTETLTATGTRQDVNIVYDEEQVANQVERVEYVSNDSGDGYDSGSQTIILSLDSYGDSDEEAAPVGHHYPAYAKHGYSGGAHHGHQNWDKPQAANLSSNDDFTNDAGDPTSDDLIITADSSDDAVVYYDTVYETVRVPRGELVEE